MEGFLTLLDRVAALPDLLQVALFVGALLTAIIVWGIASTVRNSYEPFCNRAGVARWSVASLVRAPHLIALCVIAVFARLVAPLALGIAIGSYFVIPIALVVFVWDLAVWAMKVDWRSTHFIVPGLVAGLVALNSLVLVPFMDWAGAVVERHGLEP